MHGNMALQATIREDMCFKFPVVSDTDPKKLAQT